MNKRLDTHSLKPPHSDTQYLHSIFSRRCIITNVVRPMCGDTILPYSPSSRRHLTINTVYNAVLCSEMRFPILVRGALAGEVTGNIMLGSCKGLIKVPNYFFNLADQTHAVYLEHDQCKGKKVKLITIPFKYYRIGSN